MQKLIKNKWRRESGEPFMRAHILSHEIHPEGLDVDRIRFIEAGRLAPESSVGHIISVLRGSGRLHVEGDNRQSFHLEAGVHLYLPPGLVSVLNAEQGTELLRVSQYIGLAGARQAAAASRRDISCSLRFWISVASVDTYTPVPEPPDLLAPRPGPAVKIRESCLVVSNHNVRRSRTSQ